MYIETPGYRQMFAIRLKVDRAKLEQLVRLNNVVREDPNALEMRVDVGSDNYDTCEMRPELKEGTLAWPHGQEPTYAHQEPKIYDVGWQLLGEGDLCLVCKPLATAEEFMASVISFEELEAALDKYEAAEKEAAKPKTKSSHRSFEGPCRQCLWDEIREWLSKFESDERHVRLSGAVGRTSDARKAYQASMTVTWEE